MGGDIVEMDLTSVLLSDLLTSTEMVRVEKKLERTSSKF